MKFKLISELKPKGDQPQAIEKLTRGLKENRRDQVLLGVTGSGKTFTMANIITNIQKPTLVISHNKTLAAQLYSEFKEFFPKNAVHYFVSYYDYYQPEAYVPRTDTYIEKDASINAEIDRLRHAATSSLLTRPDVLIVASVSCIYGIGSPEEYLNQAINLKVGETRIRDRVLKLLTEIQYDRNDLDFFRGRFRVRGDVVDVFPPYSEVGERIEFGEGKIASIKEFDPLTGEILKQLNKISIFPAKHFVTPKENLIKAIEQIKADLEERVTWLRKRGKELETQRLLSRTNYDIEMMLETGYCSGIENYSLYLSGRKRGEPPFTLVHYFPDDYLLFIDESHMTIPQIGGMYEGDRSRKQTLVDFGFRLPTALDNRPLKFPEFERMVNQVVYVSATPAHYEIKKSSDSFIKTSSEFFEKREKGIEVPGIVEQIIRPTGLLDPEIEIRKTEHQIDDLINEISLRVKNKQRVLVTTLTKRMAEDLADYLAEAGVKVHYLHSEIETLERPEILRDLRLGKYDVVVGINLLREGLDLPEVSLVCILDADKEGFLRSDVSLIQTIGRAARHEEGKVIMYADSITGSMRRAIEETDRRRTAQIKYNKKHGIIPQTIKKAIRESLKEKVEIKPEKEFDIARIPKDEISHLLSQLRDQMDLAARNLEFEKAAVLRDQIKEIEERLGRKRILRK